MALGDANSAILNSFKSPDSHSRGVMNVLYEVYPAFAKKIFDGNAILENMVMTGYNMMDILDYPICGKCETIALFDDPIWKNEQVVKRCTCVKPGCGQSTLNPVTFRAWIADELRHKVPPAYLSIIEFIVDDVAEKMLNVIKYKLQRQMESERAEQQNEMGIIVDEYGNNLKKENSYTERMESAPEEEPETVYINKKESNHV